jgi:uncharacterized protein (DUF2147 family)
MKTETGRRTLIVACLLASLALPMIGDGSAKASYVDGTWIIRDLVLRIFDCDRLVCGRIVWMRDAARRPSQCGKTIVWGLEAKGTNEWSGGSIFDPDYNKTYQLSAILEPNGTLHARIFKGVPLVGKTEILTRVDLRSLAGQC